VKDTFETPVSLDPYLNLSQCLKRTPLTRMHLSQSVIEYMPNWLEHFAYYIDSSQPDRTLAALRQFCDNPSFQHTALVEQYCLQLYMACLDAFPTIQLHSKQKAVIRITIQSNLQSCADGFLDRIRKLILGCQLPQNLSELETAYRLRLLERAFLLEKFSEVHTRERYLFLGQSLVHTPSDGAEDEYIGLQEDHVILKQIKQMFEVNYTAARLSQELWREPFNNFDYNGYDKSKDGMPVALFRELHNYVELILKQTIAIHDLFIVDDNYAIRDINWPFLSSRTRRFMQQKNHLRLHIAGNYDIYTTIRRDEPDEMVISLHEPHGNFTQAYFYVKRSVMHEESDLQIYELLSEGFIREAFNEKDSALASLPVSYLSHLLATRCCRPNLSPTAKALLIALGYHYLERKNYALFSEVTTVKRLAGISRSLDLADLRLVAQHLNQMQWSFYLERFIAIIIPKLGQAKSFAPRLLRHIAHEKRQVFFKWLTNYWRELVVDLTDLKAILPYLTAHFCKIMLRHSHRTLSIALQKLLSFTLLLKHEREDSQYLCVEHMGELMLNSQYTLLGFAQLCKVLEPVALSKLLQLFLPHLPNKVTNAKALEDLLTVLPAPHCKLVMQACKTQFLALTHRFSVFHKLTTAQCINSFSVFMPLLGNTITGHDISRLIRCVLAYEQATAILSLIKNELPSLTLTIHNFFVFYQFLTADAAENYFQACKEFLADKVKNSLDLRNLIAVLKIEHCQDFLQNFSQLILDLLATERDCMRVLDSDDIQITYRNSGSEKEQKQQVVYNFLRQRLITFSKQDRFFVDLQRCLQPEQIRDVAQHRDLTNVTRHHVGPEIAKRIASFRDSGAVIVQRKP